MFAGIALAVALSGYLIGNSTAFADTPGLLSVAITIDLTLLLPVIYFFLIRRTGISNLTVVPVFLLSLVAAGQILPEQHQEALDIMKLVAIPMEFLVIGWILWRVRRIIGSEWIDPEMDFIAALRRVLRLELGNDLMANIITTEVSMFVYFARLFRPRRENPGNATFTYHMRSGYIPVLCVLGLVMLLEIVGLHLLLSSWSVTVAWIFTGLSIYGAVFLMADLSAILARPISLDDSKFYLRIGLRWSADIPLSEIRYAELSRKVEKHGAHANFSLFGSPSLYLSFSGEQSATGLYGMKTRFTSLSLALDDPDEFLQELENQRPGITAQSRGRTAPN